MAIIHLRPPMNASSDSSNLDLLRSMAVLFVTGFHLLLLFEQRHSPYVKRLGVFHSIGHWGVLIFFIHTSLVLMYSLERQTLRSGGQIQYSAFLIKRLFRIYPLSVFIVCMVLIFRMPLAYLIGGVFEPARLHWTGMASNVLLLQNLTHTDSVIVPLWSLPYEMQMYLFLPVLFLLVWRLRRPELVFLLWLIAVFIDTHNGFLERHKVPDFVLYVPYFLSGVLAYALTKISRLKLSAYFWPPVLALVTALYLYRPVLRNSWIACLLLGALIPQFEEIANPVVRKVCQMIARYSYGIYLTHFICLWIAFQAIHTAPEWLRWVVFLGTGIILPYVLYHFLEEPMIRIGAKIASTCQDWWVFRRKAIQENLV